MKPLFPCCIATAATTVLRSKIIQTVVINIGWVWLAFSRVAKILKWVIQLADKRIFSFENNCAYFFYDQCQLYLFMILVLIPSSLYTFSTILIRRSLLRTWKKISKLFQKYFCKILTPPDTQYLTLSVGHRSTPTLKIESCKECFSDITKKISRSSEAFRCS